MDLITGLPFLKDWSQAVERLEAQLIRRVNVIRLLVARFLLMASMVFAFWWLNRHPV
jgi:hypothetical protein